MKRTLFYSACICLLVAFASCKKENNDPDNSDYYISAKVDGVQKTYKTNTVAVKLQVDTIYSIGLSAHANATSEESFVLNIAQVNKPITTDTYIDSGADDLIVVGGYNPGTTDDTKVYGAGLQVDANPRLKITISTLTDKNVSGTFSGTYYDDGGDGSAIIAVTEGKFNLPLY
jgi:hypothetical protein